MIYIHLDQPYEDAVKNLKEYYAEKANQGVVEHLIRAEAIRLGLWPRSTSTADPAPQPPTETP